MVQSFILGGNYISANQERKSEKGLCKLGLLNKKKEDEFTFYTNDYLIVFDEDHKTSDIKQVTGITEDSVISAGHYKVPLDDCVITVGAEGRNYFYRAPSRSITETKRLAELEKNMVLQQITAYQPPQLPTAFDWTKGLLFALIFLAFIILGFAV